MRSSIVAVFGNQFPWSYGHLRKAADHLGFWDQAEGDKINSGVEPITGTILYYAKGREAVMQFARQTPDDFVEVVGSRQTQAAWQHAQQTAVDEAVDDV